MEVKIRSIGNSMGIIFPNQLSRIMKFHVEDVVELEVDTVDKERKRLIMERKKNSLRENLLEGIMASQEDNLAFANDFDEIEGEI